MIWLQKSYPIEWSWKKVLLTAKLLILLPIIFIGARTYNIYNKVQTCATYKESINFVIQHKTTFLCVYKIKKLQDKITNYIYPQPQPIEPTKKSRRKKAKEPRKPVSDRLADWLEARIMEHLENNDKIERFEDLPRLERMAVRALDGSTSIYKWYRQMVYYITQTQK